MNNKEPIIIHQYLNGIYILLRKRNNNSNISTHYQLHIYTQLTRQSILEIIAQKMPFKARSPFLPPCKYFLTVLN